MVMKNVYSTGKIFLAFSLCSAFISACSTAPKKVTISPKPEKVVEQPKHVELSTGSMQIGRYTTVRNGATKAQVNPLLAVSIFKFPPSVYSVGDAVKQVLVSTGYSLSSSLSKDATRTLADPLPEKDMNKERYEELCKKWRDDYPNSTVADKVKLLRDESVHRILINYSKNRLPFDDYKSS